jgi:predicted nucleic acid-binding protein
LPVRGSSVSGAAPAGALRYVETSVVVAALLEGDTAARRLLLGGRAVTSALTIAEALRVTMRARAAGRLSADDERAVVAALHEAERGWAIVAVTDAVLARVGSRFPVEPVRTLDAIHLATAGILGLPPQLVTVVTRDRRVSENARALGHPVEG